MRAMPAALASSAVMVTPLGFSFFDSASSLSVVIVYATLNSGTWRHHLHRSATCGTPLLHGSPPLRVMILPLSPPDAQLDLIASLSYASKLARQDHIPTPLTRPGVHVEQLNGEDASSRRQIRPKSESHTSTHGESRPYTSSATSPAKPCTDHQRQLPHHPSICSSTTGRPGRVGGGGGGTFRLSTMFLLTAACMAVKGTVVPRSCDVSDAAGAASADLTAGGPDGAGPSAAAGAGAAPHLTSRHSHTSAQGVMHAGGARGQIRA